MSSKTIQITSLLAALMLGLASPAFAQQDSSNSNDQSSESTDSTTGSSQKGAPDDATGATATPAVPAPTGHQNAPATSECPPGQTKSATTNLCE